MRRDIIKEEDDDDSEGGPREAGKGVGDRARRAVFGAEDAGDVELDEVGEARAEVLLLLLLLL